MNDATEERLEDLLAEWELARQSGHRVTAVELCQEMPELVAPLQARIELLQQTAWMMEDRTTTNADQAVEPSDTILPDSDVTIAEFIDEAKHNGLLSGDQLESVHRFVDDHADVDSKLLAHHLVDQHALTEYQARVLLERGNSPLLLDRYIILDTIGAGGMGLVFKAFHRSMERTVALKVLPEYAVDSPEKVARFEREIKAAARLSHPNVVTALDAHESNGTRFLVMEYVDGQNLHDYVQDHGPLSVEEATQVIADVAAGLTEAHRHGIVHRDVKPRNIMLTRQGVAKLLDLGLSRMSLSANTNAATELTRDGLAMGTVAFMSPEQALDAKDADERSDIYSLGCTLYYALTGTPPFDRETSVKTIFAHREETPPALSETRSDVPAALSATYERMVAKLPQDRHQSADEIINELNADGTASISPPKLVESHTNPKKHEATKNLPSRHAVNPRLVLSIAFVLGIALTAWFIKINGSSVAPRSPRDLALSILSAGGDLELDTEFGPLLVIDASEIPDGDFTITAVNAFGPLTSVQLEAIEALSHLQTLSITGVTKDDLLFADDVINPTSASTAWSLTDVDLKAISQIKTLSILELVGHTQVTDQGIAELANLASLTDLTIDNCSVGARAIQPLTQLKALSALQLANVPVHAETLSEFSLTVDYLQLQWCELHGDFTNIFSDFDKLQLLDLTDSDFENSIVPSLLSLRRLDALYLGGTNITANAIGQLAELRSLTHLDLSYLELDEAMWTAILSLRNIESLDLSGTVVDDESIKRLATLPKLESINATDSNMTVAGAEAFVKDNPTFQVILDSFE